MSSNVLIELEPGPMPTIPKAMWATILEWITAWKHEEVICEAGLMPPGALLLYGPTGTGKTSLTKAILKQMSGRDGLLMEAHTTIDSKLGESPRNIADAFKRAARERALLVIEEIDSMGLERALSKDNGCGSERNNITIALMRHLEQATFPVIATTNYKDRLDPALLRRFELQLEVPMLDEKGRALILKKILGVDAAPELIALPLVESIREAHRIRRRQFIAELEGAK